MMKKKKSNKKIAKHKLRTVLFSIGLLFCLAGCGKTDEVIILSGGESEEETGKDKTTALADSDEGETIGGAIPTVLENNQTEGNTTVCVYICGAVNSPGVVEIPADSRVEDALMAAGGFAENACRDYVNLAAKVVDGEMIYFPDMSERETLKKAQAQEDAGMVDINTATVEALCTLPGIGETKAEAIVSYRETNGTFQNIEEIMNVPGIKAQAFEKIKNIITVG